MMTLWTSIKHFNQLQNGHITNHHGPVIKRSVVESYNHNLRLWNCFAIHPTPNRSYQPRSTSKQVFMMTPWPLIKRTCGYSDSSSNCKLVISPYSIKSGPVTMVNRQAFLFLNCAATIYPFANCSTFNKDLIGISTTTLFHLKWAWQWYLLSPVIRSGSCV